MALASLSTRRLRKQHSNLDAERDPARNQRGERHIRLPEFEPPQLFVANADVLCGGFLAPSILMPQSSQLRAKTPLLSLERAGERRALPHFERSTFAGSHRRNPYQLGLESQDS